MTNTRKLKGLLAAALLLLWQSAASATTIYFAGGEDVDFNVFGTVNTATTLTPYRSSWSRFAINLNNSTTVADPPANRIQTPTFASVSTLWIHGQVFSNGATTTSGEQILLVRSPDGVSRIVLRQTGTNGQMKVSTRNAAGTITDLATASGTWSNATLTAFDMKIVYGCTSGDQVQVWLATTQVINYTGSSICTDSATSLNQVDFAAIGNNNNTTSNNWSEIIVSDSDTRGMGLWTLNPVAAGNTQSWTPNTVGDVNPSVINDTNFVSTSSSSALSEWTTPTTAPSGTFAVLAVVQSARLLRGSTGPQNFDYLMRTKDGSDHLFGYSSTVTTSFSNFPNLIWTTNPHTSAPFVLSDIASGFNLGIESLP